MAFAQVLEALATLKQADLVQLSDGERRQLVQSAKTLLYQLQGPSERIQEQALVEPFSLGVLKTLQDLQIFEKWQLDGTDIMSTSDLAALVTADPVLIGRLLRHLASIDGIEITGPESWRMNDYSRHLATAEAKACIDVGLTVNSPAVRQMPSWLNDLSYKNPIDPNNTAFIRSTSHAKDTHFFEWLTVDTKRVHMYEMMVSQVTASSESWVDLVPLESFLLAAESMPQDRAMLVDVGGGRGGPIEEFRLKLADFSPQRQRLILQDQPSVIAQLSLNDAIETMAYDFFSPQPIKGARIYFLKSVLHDWPREQCRSILTNQAAAMERGFSKLLINEHVVSVSRAPTRLAASLDITMMLLGSAVERTLQQWHDVLAGTGLKIVKVWEGRVGSEAIIECELE